eukprot:CAMPEP_0196763186 /NCGR_PEP_ID=MMETSP1095-20130614/3618_1 /TAXON_ID=96789 ORGANISM="Chromulina nebulosa, Strain UTEXLB2642" /NCGR_SAMPLE_ID=MMETSP1095 /ASSEMBLY_ACC=CAM_ASM_000446 /LENGTH=394 /DNA_ID=CAMNT_0042115875 /DNA_START=185 /DNA_END=1369 /DNA_ORIENTATION=-
MYDFHKTVQDPSHGEFQHQYFKRNRPDLLVYIKRKAHNKPPNELQPTINNKKNAKQLSQSYDSFEQLSNQYIDNYNPTTQRIEREAELVMSEMNKQSKIRNEIENRLINLETQHGQLENENAYLRRLVVESNEKQAVMQERMENVMRALYMYVNGANSVNNVPQLLSRMPSLLLADTLNPTSVMKYIEDSSLPLSAITEGEGAEDPLVNTTTNSDTFGLGLELSQQNSFDVSFINHKSSFEYDAPHNSVSNKDLEGSALSRLASFGTSSPFAALVNTRKEKDVISDRVTELETIEQPIKKQKFIESIDLDIENPIPLNKPELSESYLHLLSRRQDTTLERLDTLELTIQTLLNGESIEDYDLADEASDINNSIDSNHVPFEESGNKVTINEHEL